MPLHAQQRAPSGAFCCPGRECVPLKPLVLLVLLALMICPTQSEAATSATGASKSHLDLSHEATWLRLLHFQGGIFGSAMSAIHSPEFFLDPNGMNDPAAELDATLLALGQPVVQGREDDHVACRFPARRLWLESHIPGLRIALRGIPVELHCGAFEAWSQPHALGSISLMFANGYLGNPASYYGHLFLKFNSETGSQSYLIDRTENFGALDVKEDNPVEYIVKALIGGYDGGFSQIDFFYQDAAYTENEFRDLWEYRLDLTPAEVNFVTAHAWEIDHKRYTYFFFHDNCAFRVAELLELLDGVQAVPPDAPWVIPQAVVKMVAAQIRDGKPLVKERKLHPSRQSILYRRYSALSGVQQAMVHSVAAHEIAIGDPAFKVLPEPDQAKIVDTLLDYYQFTSGSVDSGGEKHLPKEYVTALNARFALPPESTDTLAQTQASHDRATPDSGHPPGWVQIGLGSQEGLGAVQTIRIRPAYYDDLDSDAAQPPWSSLSMGDLTLERQNDTAQVKRLDFVAISSNRPSVTGLQGDGGNGWTARFGLEKQSLTCADCLVWRFQGAYRRAIALPAPDAMLAVGLGGGVQSNRNEEGIAFSSAILKIARRFQGGSHINFSQDTTLPSGRAQATRHISGLEWRTPINRTVDLRLLWEHDGLTRTTIGFGAYW